VRLVPEGRDRQQELLHSGDLLDARQEDEHRVLPRYGWGRARIGAGARVLPDPVSPSATTTLFTPMVASGFSRYANTGGLQRWASTKGRVHGVGGPHAGLVAVQPGLHLLARVGGESRKPGQGLDHELVVDGVVVEGEQGLVGLCRALRVPQCQLGGR
jgi:hypothetical protein